MDADDETARMPTRPAGETRPLTQEYLIEHRQRQEAEAEVEAKRELSQAAEWAEMDSGTHEELSDWMSQLFEKLDLEVNEDNICSTGNVTEVEAHPVAEEVISSKIQMAPKLKDSSMVEMDARSPEEKITDWLLKLRAIQAYIIKKGARRKKRFFESSAQEQMPREEEVPTMAEMDSGIHGEELSDWMSQLFEKLDLEVNEDNICSTGNVTEVEAHPIAKEVISPKIQMPTKLKDSSMAHTDINGFEWMSVVDDSDFGNEDAFLDWIVDMLKKGGRDDLLSQFDLDQADVSYDVQDELSDLDEDVEDSHTSVKRASNKETLENGIKWMSEECFLAFLESAERKRFEGIEHRFGELRSQCLNIEAYDKIFHHYNFTIEAKHGSSDI